MLKCYKCAHYYRIMATEAGYNPAPTCRLYEDTGARPNFMTQDCFRPIKRRKVHRAEKGGLEE